MSCRWTQPQSPAPSCRHLPSAIYPHGRVSPQPLLQAEQPQLPWPVPGVPQASAPSSGLVRTQERGATLCAPSRPVFNSSYPNKTLIPDSRKEPPDGACHQGCLEGRPPWDATIGATPRPRTEAAQHVQCLIQAHFKLKLLNPKLKRDEQSLLLISTPSLELSQPIQVLAQVRSHDSGPSPGLLHWL